MLPRRNGSRLDGPVKRRQKKRLKMGGRRDVGVRLPSTGHWGEAEGELLPLGWRVKKEILVVFHLLFIWMLSLLLVCLLSWNSVISLILKFKYINFYLVYRYLCDFCVGAFVCVWVSEVVWCTWHTVWELMRACGLKKGGALGVLMGCGFFRNSRKPFDSFHWVSFGLCSCQSMSLLWSLAQYE